MVEGYGIVNLRFIKLMNLQCELLVHLKTIGWLLPLFETNFIIICFVYHSKQLHSKRSLKYWYFDRRCFKFYYIEYICLSPFSEDKVVPKPLKRVWTLIFCSAEAITREDAPLIVQWSLWSIVAQLCWCIQNFKTPNSLVWGIQSSIFLGGWVKDKMMKQAYRACTARESQNCEKM